MPLVTFGSSTYTLDQHGFLEHPSFWDEQFAEGMAPRVGVGAGLTQDHWEVIGYLRRKLELEDDVPYFVTACQELGLRIAQFRGLFPTGYMRGALRVAGLSYAFIADRKVQQTYETLTTIWTRYRLTPLGFLERFEDWDPTYASLVAAEWDLPCGVTEVHSKVIRFLRGRYQTTGVIPTVFETCKANNLSLEELRALFPAGYRRGACRMAGLPFA